MSENDTRCGECPNCGDSGHPYKNDSRLCDNENCSVEVYAR